MPANCDLVMRINFSRKKEQKHFWNNHIRAYICVFVDSFDVVVVSCVAFPTPRTTMFRIYCSFVGSWRSINSILFIFCCTNNAETNFMPIAAALIFIDYEFCVRAFFSFFLSRSFFFSIRLALSIFFIALCQGKIVNKCSFHKRLKLITNTVGPQTSKIHLLSWSQRIQIQSTQFKEYF